MAEAGERTVAALKVSRAEVIQDQRAFREMAFGESVLDTLLTRQQPIESVIELGFIDGIVGWSPELRQQLRHSLPLDDNSLPSL